MLKDCKEEPKSLEEVCESTFLVKANENGFVKLFNCCGLVYADEMNYLHPKKVDCFFQSNNLHKFCKLYLCHKYDFNGTC